VQAVTGDGRPASSTLVVGRSLQMKHRFEPGQRVAVTAGPMSPAAPRGVYKVVLQLPPEGGENMYRVKSDLESHERMVGESKLTRVS
jgi:hypothetical protein